MKKAFLGCLAVLSMCFGLYADSTADTQFKQYVEVTRNNKENPEGMTVCADNTYRILYMAFPLPVNSSDVTPEVLKAAKKEMLAEMAKDDDDKKVIKDLKISIVFTFVTTDKRMFSINISHMEL